MGLQELAKKILSFGGQKEPIDLLPPLKLAERHSRQKRRLKDTGLQELPQRVVLEQMAILGYLTHDAVVPLHLVDELDAVAYVLLLSNKAVSLRKSDLAEHLGSDLVAVARMPSRPCCDSHQRQNSAEAYQGHRSFLGWKHIDREPRPGLAECLQ